MTIIPTPIVDEDEGKREVVDLDKKSKNDATRTARRSRSRASSSRSSWGSSRSRGCSPSSGCSSRASAPGPTSRRPAGGPRSSPPFQTTWTLEPFAQAWVALDAGTTFWNSVAVTVPATVLPVMIAAMAAYAFTFFQFRGKEIYFAVILGLMVVPVQIAVIPILQLFVWFGNTTGIQIIGQYPAAWIVHATFAMPLAIYILRNYMQTLPNSLIEAARVDGASHFQIFWRLIVPMSVPALASFAIFQFLWVWNDFFVAYLFIQSGPNQVLTQGLYTLLGQYGQGWQRVAAGSFITLVVPLVIFFGLQRFFVRGLTAGSVK